MSELCVVCCDADTDHSLRDTQSMDSILFFWTKPTMQVKCLVCTKAGCAIENAVYETPVFK